MRTAIGFAIAIVGIIAAFFGGRFFAASNSPSLAAQIFPSPTPINNAAVITQVQALSRLETFRYAIEKIIPEEKRVEASAFGQTASINVDTLLLVAHGEIIAGVDLSKITDSNIVVSDETVTLTLPPVEIFNLNNVVDEKETYVYQREGLLFLEDKDLEAKARLRAATELVVAACEAGIFTMATDNAVVSIERLLTPIAPHVLVIPGSIPACPVQSAATPTP